MYKLGRRNKDAVYIDIGANIGNASRYFYPYAKKIYAIEPNPDIYQALVENTKNLPNIETFNCAIGHVDGVDYLYSNENSQLAQSFWGNSNSTSSIRVVMKSLKTFMSENKIDHVDVLKIDVEGAEYIILPSNTFKEVADKIDFIIGESHYITDNGFPQIIPLILRDYGFETKFIQLDRPNYTRTFVFTDVASGTRKKWTYPESTMFISQRK
jgi:FkbM family methyltransferase